MKWIKVFLFGVALFSTSLIYAQSAFVSGTTSHAGKPLEFVSILLLKDSAKQFASAFSDTLGRFHLNNIPPGNYTLRLQMIGYQTKNIPLNVISGVNLLEDVNLSPIVSQLKTVEVVSLRKMIKKTPNGFIINAQDNIAQMGGTATDLLSNTPTVVVDPENGITIRGKTPLILINGRNSNIRSIDNIPASSIESIEIINNPSAQYDAEAEGGVINIVLKKNTGKGTNGSFVLGSGVGAKGRMNSAVSLGQQIGKWNIGLNYDNRFAGRTRHADAERINYFIPENYRQLQNRNDKRYEATQNAKLTIDFAPDKNHSFGLEVNGNSDEQHNIESLLTNINRSNKSFVSANKRVSDEDEKEKAIDYTLIYDQKFANPKKKLGISLTSGLSKAIQNTGIPTTSLDSVGIAKGSDFVQRTDNFENAGVSNAKLDYVFPITASSVLEMGYKGTFRHIDADFVSEYLQNGSYVPDQKASNHFIFNESIQAGYLQYKGDFKRSDLRGVKYDLGLRAEQTNNSGKNGSGVSLLNNSYIKLFPTATVSYFINASDFFKIGYYKRINRPGLGQLNPFIDITDSLNPHGGNPYLQPEIVHAFETGLTKNWHKTNLTFNVFYRHALNSMRTIISLNTNGVALVLPQNIGTNDTYGFESIGSFEPLKFWMFNASVSLFRQQFNASNITTGSRNGAISGYGKLINNISFTKQNKMQLIYNYMAPSVTPQGTRIAVYNTDFGFQQKFGKGRGALGIVITDIFNTQRNGFKASSSDFNYYRYFKVDTRAILVSLAWTFRTKLRDELLENKFTND